MHYRYALYLSLRSPTESNADAPENTRLEADTTRGSRSGLLALSWSSRRSNILRSSRSLGLGLRLLPIPSAVHLLQITDIAQRRPLDPRSHLRHSVLTTVLRSSTSRRRHTYSPRRICRRIDEVRSDGSLRGAVLMTSAVLETTLRRRRWRMWPLDWPLRLRWRLKLLSCSGCDGGTCDGSTLAGIQACCSPEAGAIGVRVEGYGS